MNQENVQSEPYEVLKEASQLTIAKIARVENSVMAQQ